MNQYTEINELQKVSVTMEYDPKTDIIVHDTWRVDSLESIPHIGEALEKYFEVKESEYDFTNIADDGSYTVSIDIHRIERQLFLNGDFYERTGLYDRFPLLKAREYFMKALEDETLRCKTKL